MIVKEQTISGYAASKDGTKIAYSVSGEGEPTLVLVHGWCGNSSHWQEQVKSLAAAGHKVVTLDLAGHGKSGTGRSQWSIENFAEDVVAVVKKLNLDKVVLVGHSMGGRVVVEAASRLPNNTMGVIGVEALWNVESTAQMDIQPWRDDFEKTATDYVATMFTPNSPAGLRECITAEVLATDKRAAIGSIEAINGNRTTLLKGLDTLQARKVPVHLVNATGGFRVTDRVVAARHGISVSFVEGAGHYVMLEAPQAVDERIRSIAGTFAPRRSFGFSLWQSLTRLVR